MYHWYSLYHRKSAVHPWMHLVYQLLTRPAAEQMGRRYAVRNDLPWWQYGNAPAFILVEHGTGRWMGI